MIKLIPISMKSKKNYINQLWDTPAVTTEWHELFINILPYIFQLKTIREIFFLFSYLNWIIHRQLICCFKRPTIQKASHMLQCKREQKRRRKSCPKFFWAIIYTMSSILINIFLNTAFYYDITIFEDSQKIIFGNYEEEKKSIAKAKRNEKVLQFI